MFLGVCKPIQSAKKVDFTECQLADAGQKISFQLAQKKNWMLFEFPSKYLTFLSVNLRTEFTCPVAKSTSPGY